MSKINLDDYIEKVDIVNEYNDEIFVYPVDKGYKKSEKIKHRKHHFNEGRNLERLHDRKKNHRTIRTDKVI